MYKPPPGPPPGWTGEVKEEENNPPPYHNWQEQVPDTATLPPPPAIGRFASETGNASGDDADRAKEFCDERPLWRPVQPSETIYRNSQQGDIRPGQPIEFRGNLEVHGTGHWKVKSDRGSRDCCIISLLPLYYAMRDSPLVTESSKTIYFEVRINRFLHHQRRPFSGEDDESPSLSIGYVAQPYPTWRSPGWDRGSIGVFSDDGCRFVNDSFGGKNFTEPIRAGETVGLGMTFALRPTGPSAPRAGIAVRVFFTRNGVEVGDWNLHEELDSEAGGVLGLEGDFDLYAAVGIFGGVEFDVKFNRQDWMARFAA